MTVTHEQTEVARKGFPSPFEVPIPPSCEGWEEMYAYQPLQRGSARLRREPLLVPGRVALRRALLPVRLVFFDNADAASTRRAPPVRRPALARPRVPGPQRLRLPQRQLGHRRGDACPAGGAVREAGRLLLRALGRARCPLAGEGRADDTGARGARGARASRVRGRVDRHRGPGVGSSHALLLAYDRLLEGFDRICQYHFELLNLGYGAYLVFYELCRQAFPGISDQTSRQDGLGDRLVALRPDDELRRLARLAVELGVAEPVKARSSEEELRACPRRSEAGEHWLADFEADEEPLVLLLVRERPLPPSPLLDRRPDAADRDDRLLHRATRGRRGHLAVRSEALVAERDRITDEYRALLPERDASRPSTSSSRSHARSSLTSRTTTSTSTTGPTRSSGTRCASSARC